MVENIVGSVIAGLIVAVVLWLWARGRLVPQWYREQRDADRAMKREEASWELARLREQVLKLARARNVVVPVSARGVDPAIVEFSDGSRRFYFADHGRYVQAMRELQVPPTRAFRREPPVPLSRWSRDALTQWLAKHAD